MGWWYLFRNSLGRVGGIGGRGGTWIFMIMKMFDDRRCNKEKKKQFQYDVSCSRWTICVLLRRRATVGCWFFVLFLLQARAAAGILSISAHSVICGGENERQILRLIGYDHCICPQEIFDECLNLTLWACSSARQPPKKNLSYSPHPRHSGLPFFSLHTPLPPPTPPRLFSLLFLPFIWDYDLSWRLRGKR